MALTKEDILRVLTDWNFWGKGLETGITRDMYLDRTLGFLKSNMVVAVMGVRRAGKSFIVRQMARALISSGVPPEDILYVNFEERLFSSPTADLLDKIEETYLENIDPSGQRYVFLDEVHLVKGWERWVRTRQELGCCRLAVTGSNTDLMRGDLASSLTGRHLDVTVLPLGLREFLEFRGTPARSLREYLGKRTAINRLFKEYMEFGGFPQVALTDAKREVLGAYFDDIMTKDIVRRHKVREVGKLYSLAEFFLTNISCPVSFRSLEPVTGLSVNTLEKFSGYLESAMMVLFVGRFGWSFRERTKSPRKVYAIDTGLSSVVGFRFSENRGAVAENIVALELLRRRNADPSLEIFYWKDETGREVDFVVKRGKRVTDLIQVCWNISEPRTKEREISALIAAMEKLGLKRALVLNDDVEAVEKVAGKTIEFRTIVKWLLDIG